MMIQITTKFTYLHYQNFSCHRLSGRWWGCWDRWTLNKYMLYVSYTWDQGEERVGSSTSINFSKIDLSTLTFASLGPDMALGHNDRDGSEATSWDWARRHAGTLAGRTRWIPLELPRMVLSLKRPLIFCLAHDAPTMLCTS